MVRMRKNVDSDLILIFQRTSDGCRFCEKIWRNKCSKGSMHALNIEIDSWAALMVECSGSVGFGC